MYNEKYSKIVPYKEQKTVNFSKFLFLFFYLHKFVINFARSCDQTTSDNTYKERLATQVTICLELEAYLKAKRYGLVKQLRSELDNQPFHCCREE